MTARGELYIDEDCRDAFEKELNEWFGKDEWKLDGSDFSDYWDMSNFPDEVEVNVSDNEQEEIIGKVLIKSKICYEDMGAGIYEEREPKSIELLECRDELRNMVLKKVNQEEDKNG